MGIMRIPSLLLALPLVNKTTIAYGFMIVVIGVAISTSSVFITLSALLPNQQSAFATFPGENGKIAFQRGGGIWVMNADGSGQTNLNTDGDDPDWSPDSTKIAFGRAGTHIIIINADGSGGETELDPGDANWDPSWSPDGTKIAFVKEVDECDWQIYVMNADGSGSQRQLTNLAPNCVADAPDWSPDGTKIAFRGIYVMNADGSGVTRLTDGTDPSWSPDGTKIAFERENQIYVMNADGTGQTNLNAGGTHPSWSPDGTKIVFASFRDGNYEIYVMNADDGTGQTRLTNNPASDIRPDWGTAPATEPEPIQTVLTLNTITSVPWGKDVTVTGKLADASNGQGIGGKTITFDGTGAANLPDVVTSADGTFTAKGASPNTVATGWTVQAHFAGDSEYIASDSASKTYNTLKHSVNLVVTAKSSVPWGKPTTFTATLTDTSLGGVPISGKTIHFDGTGVIPPSDKRNDSSGKAISTGTAPKTVAPGWTYQAHFAGDSLYNAKDSASKTYSTTKHATSLTLVVSPSSVTSGGTYKVYGFLKDSSSSGAPISSKTIVITADSPIAIPSKTTDATGKYNIEGLKAPTRAGTYDIQAHFYGDNLYSAKDSPTRTLTVTTATSSATTTSDSTETSSSTTSSEE
jgi:WD40-like Beta Propeller Repeat